MPHFDYSYSLLFKCKKMSCKKAVKTLNPSPANSFITKTSKQYHKTVKYVNFSQRNNYNVLCIN